MYALLRTLHDRGADRTPLFSIKTSDGSIYFGPIQQLGEEHLIVSSQVGATATSLGETIHVAVALSAITTVSFHLDQ